MDKKREQKRVNLKGRKLFLKVFNISTEKWKKAKWKAFIFVILKIFCYNKIMEQEKYLGLIENEKREQFDKFSYLLTEYNKICNLTSVTDPKGVEYKHFYDSIFGEKLISFGASVVEIGSGGGFPSIPLKIVRDDLKFTLIESTEKKCRFLRSVVESLSLKCVQVQNIRAEEGAHNKNLREKFDFAVARAVAQLNTLCEYCLPFVRVGGKFIAYKGDNREEINSAENAIKVLGGEIEEIVDYSLPEDFGKRKLVVIRKIKNTPPLYPRGQGKERKQPL